jgi:hypothetical protein
LRARAEPRFPGPTMLTVGRLPIDFRIAVSITNEAFAFRRRPPTLLYSDGYDST